MNYGNHRYGEGRASTALRATLAAFLTVLTMTIIFAPPAKAQEADRPEGLVEHGPVDPASGYPYWYEDANGIRLELCLDPQDQMCLQPFESPDPNGEVSFPENFPGESFWWAGEAEMTLPNGGDAQLTMAHEAAFAAEVVRDGDQISFGRIRVRIDNLIPGEAYTVTHPYGTDTFIAEDDGDGGGEINYTEDMGCMMPSTPDGCNFNEARFSRVGPFLTWDTFGRGTDENLAIRNANGDVVRPDAYVGDPEIPHAVVGSAIPNASHASGFQNFFGVEGPGVGGPDNSARTDLFSVSGKVAGPTASASPKGGPDTTTPREVSLRAKDTSEVQGDLKIYYTTDGSEPTLQSESFTNSGTIRIDSDTTLRFMAVNEAGVQSRFYTENYTIDNEPPTVQANPGAGTFNTPQEVTLTANDGGAAASVRSLSSSDGGSDSTPPASTSGIQPRIYYTTDGTRPTTGSTLYRDPITVDRSRTIKAIAVDAAGNRSEVASFGYTIDTVAPNVPTASVPGGSFNAARQVTLRTDDPAATIHYTTNGSDPTTRSPRYSGPITINRTTTLKYMAVDPAGNRSKIATRNYTIRRSSAVLLRLSDGELKTGQRQVISGRVAPGHVGKVRLIVRKPGKNLVRNLRLKGSHYRFVYRPGRVGRYSVTVRFAGDADHRPSAATRSFRGVHR